MFFGDSESPSEDPQIQQYATNDSLFRRDVTFGEYTALPAYRRDEFPDEASYRTLVQHLPGVLMIDLGDIRKYLKITDEPGFDGIDVEYIASIVCDYLATEEDLVETLWNNIDDDIIADITARLGVDIDNYMVGPNFDKAIAVVADIARLVERYLVNARFPIIDGQSVYTCGDYRHGIIALRLRTYVELQQDH